jgi:hypothetical protein
LLGHNSNLERLGRNPNLILLSQSPFPTMAKDKAVITMLLMLGVVVMAVTNILSF